jgi:hypothetical protein
MDRYTKCCSDGADEAYRQKMIKHGMLDTTRIDQTDHIKGDEILHASCKDAVCLGLRILLARTQIAQFL